jgi:hypothetical protein
VRIPRTVTQIKNSVFYDCENLLSVSIPDGVRVIGENFIFGCTSITSVTIPSGVVEIEGYAFAKTALTSVVIPASVTTVGTAAFYDCDKLTAAYFEGNAPADFGILVFSGTHRNFKIYYKRGTTGWTNPFDHWAAEEYG